MKEVRTTGADLVLRLLQAACPAGVDLEAVALGTAGLGTAGLGTAGLKSVELGTC